MIISNAGFASIPKDHLFLDASSDGYVYDPNELKYYGLVEVKCHYEYRGYAPAEASIMVVSSVNLYV